MNRVRGLIGLPRQIWAYARLERVTWIEDRVGACSYPRDATSLNALAAAGVSILINLHERGHAPDFLAPYGLTQVHLPVRDFTAPTTSQLVDGVAVIASAVADGRRVMVHCGAGLGRTGTLLACYLVTRGLSPAHAIARMRALRPGSVETREQEAAVAAFANRVRMAGPTGP